MRASPGHREGIFSQEILHEALDQECGPLSSSGALLLPLDQVLCPRHTQRPSTARLLLLPSPQSPGALPAFPPGHPPTDGLGRAASPGAHAGAPSSSSHPCSSGRCLGLSLTPLGPHAMGSIAVPKLWLLGLAPRPAGNTPPPPQMPHWSLQLNSLPHLPPQCNTTIPVP